MIAEAGRVRVVVNDSTAYQGTVLGSDPVRDLAVVSICCGSFHSLSFGDVSQLKPGDAVFALGYPRGLLGAATLTDGIVSAIRYSSNHQSDVIQTNAAINFGNSGGPMLSVAGEILGIITFKFADIGDEGLGFAVSSKTVQQRIPALRTAAPQPTPAPTLARPTPSAGGASTFGPISGDLRHNPADGFIQSKYASVTFADVVVEATFSNPYSAGWNSWDYGFIIRDNGHPSSRILLQAVVNSDRQWELGIQDGTNSPRRVIALGTLSNFDVTELGRNHLRVVVIGERGWFFVNGRFVSALDLSAATNFGDIAVITGAFSGNEIAGAVTRFENFKITGLTKRYGPSNGRLVNQPGQVTEHESGVWTRDIVMETNFESPRGSEWSYGFIIRNPISNQLEVIGVDGEAWWFHHTRNPADVEYTIVSADHLGLTLRDMNHLLLIAIEDSGWFFINGRLAGKLDLSHNQDSGSVSAMANFYLSHRASPGFENFNVWAP